MILQFPTKIPYHSRQAMINIDSQNSEIVKLQQEIRVLKRKIRALDSQVQHNKATLAAKSAVNNLAEAQKEKAERNISLLLDNSPDIILLFDSDERLSHASRAFLKACNIEHIGLINAHTYGQIFDDFLPFFDKKELHTLILQSIKSNKILQLNKIIPFPGHPQKNLYIIYIIPMLNCNGLQQGLMLLFHDLSEMARARDKAEKANNAKREFLANMSHEIRTPMNAILGMLQLIQSPELPPLPTIQADYAQKAELSARTLLRILNDILDFSKIEAGQLDVETIEFSLDNVIKQIKDTFELEMKSKNLTLTINVPNFLPKTLMGDPLRLAQILLNLINNSIKFTEKGGITLNIEPQVPNKGQIEIIFRITDTGIGMTEKQLSRIFIPFNQTDSSITRRFGGTGLGLTICQMLVRLMGGDIKCHSKPGVGTTFIFSVNFQLSQNDDCSLQISKQPLIIHKFKDVNPILLVEDNELNQLVATRFLERFGLTVEVAGNGLEALRMLDGPTQYSLVLMDLQMPMMDGITATREIRKRERYNSLPVIAMTAHAMIGDREKSLKAGMNDHLVKPIDVKNLNDIVLKWIRNNDDFSI